MTARIFSSKHYNTIFIEMYQYLAEVRDGQGRKVTRWWCIVLCHVGVHVCM